jgi:hypothetical protein
MIPFRTFGIVPYATREGVRYISSRHSELYPLEKPAGTFRVVTFGGSSTEQKVGGAHYPLLLQSALRDRLNRDTVEVINVGNAAYATPHSLILLELDVLSWDPDLVILSENTNDRSATYFPNFTFDYSNKYSDPFYLGQNLTSRYSTMNALFQHSRVYWVARDKLITAIDKLNSSDKLTRRRPQGHDPNPEGREVFKRNLRSFVTLAHSNGIEVILASQPLGPANLVAIPYERPYNKNIFLPLVEEEISHHASYNRAIEEVAKETGVWFVDSAQVMNGVEEYFIDSVHYKEAGLRKLAQNYSDFIIGSNLMK